MNAHGRSTELPPFTIPARGTLPVHERVLDGLADLLFDVDSVLDLLKAEDAGSMRSVKPHVQKVYDEVNQLMKRLSD